MGQEFALMFKEEVHDRFEESFILWCRAILALYCKLSQIKSSALQTEMRNYSEDLDDRTVADNKNYINYQYYFCYMYSTHYTHIVYNLLYHVFMV